MPDDRNITLCLISEIFFPEDQGGQGQQAFELARRLALRGVRVRVITRRNFPTSARHERLGDVDIARIGPSGLLKGRGWAALPRTLWFLLALLVRTWSAARESDAVLVHGAKWILLPVMFAARLSRRAHAVRHPAGRATTVGVPCIVKIDALAELQHDITPESLARMGLHVQSRVLAPWRRLRSAMLRRAAAIIAISNEIAAELRARGVEPARIARIPNGIDLQHWQHARADKHALRASLQLPEGVLVICSGRLARSKGALSLLDAWVPIARDRRDAHLVLIGGGARSFDDCETQLRERVRTQQLDGQVHFIGQVDNVADYLHASDVYVLNSESEGFGLSLVEAMAAGLPCVATRVSVAPEIIVDGVNSSLIPARGTAALREGLQAMLDSEQSRRRMAAAAQAAAVHHFNIDAIVDRYVRLFEQRATPLDQAPVHAA